MGRLIDEDAVKRRMHETMDYQDLYLPVHFEMCMNDVPTIEPASPWHRVEDELPKEKNWVLVWHTGYATPKKAKFIVDVIPEFLFDGGGGAWELDGWSDNKGKVTHWMPLPEPPKEDA